MRVAGRPLAPMAFASVPLANAQSLEIAMFIPISALVPHGPTGMIPALRCPIWARRAD